MQRDRVGPAYSPARAVEVFATSNVQNGDAAIAQELLLKEFWFDRAHVFVPIPPDAVKEACFAHDPEPVPKVCREVK